MRPIARALLVGSVKLFQRYAELRGRPTYFVDRNEPAVNVASGVLESLSHHRAGQLLEFKHEAQAPPILLHGRRITNVLQQENAAQEIESCRIGALVAPFRSRDGFLDVGAVA